jgi:DNA-binding transcriptional regulator GbsR (MarR family)
MSKQIFELLRADNTICVNRTLAAAIGLNEAIIYSALLAKEHYYGTNGQLDGEDMFYATAADLEESTTLSQYQQDRAIKNLEKFELVSTKIKGLPARKYFKINENIEIISKFLACNTDKNKLKNTKQDIDKTQTNKQQNLETGVEDNSQQAENKTETQFQQNLETGVEENSQQAENKTETRFQQNLETINIKHNNKTNIKNINSACARDETDDLKIPPENKNFEKQADNNFDEIINGFTKNEKVRTALWEYVKMRLKKPKTVTTDYILTLAVKHLGELSSNPETQTEILNQSILNSYTDLYELKKKGENNDYSRNYAGNPKDDKVYYTGLADKKTDGNRFKNLPGVIRLG